MTPVDFIRFAGRLAASGTGGEAAVRTIAGRAYYGAFHLVLSYLELLGFAVPANSNAHGLVRRYLSGSGHSDMVRVSEFLANLHAVRIRADYRLSDARFGDFEVARRYVENADEVRMLLDGCTQEPIRTDVRDAINAYLARLN